MNPVASGRAATACSPRGRGRDRPAVSFLAQGVGGVQQPTVWLALAAGMASCLSPCILPLLPSFLAYLSGLPVQQLAPTAPAAGAQPGSGPTPGGVHPPAGMAPAGLAWRSRTLVLAHAAAFVAGLSVIFLALGWAAAWVGRFFWDYREVLQRLGGLAILVLGLHQAGLLPIPGLEREWRLQASRKPAGLLGSFLVGLTFAAGWTPCVGPILSSILVLAGTTPDAALVLMAAYALGMGLPFLALALGLHRLMALRRHAPKLRRVGGLVLASLGILLASGGLLRLTGWLLSWWGPLAL